MEGNETLLYTSLGELINMKREEMGLSLSELGRLTGIHKSVLGRIEQGETKRPELNTIKAIADVLTLPYKDIIEYYAEIEQRINVLHKLLLESIEVNNVYSISKVANKILESPYEETYTSLEYLYKLTHSINSSEIKITLYKIIAKYAREHGAQIYLAKSLLQQYLIERDDFSKLDTVYQSAKYILYYADFLPSKDRILMYYKLGVHAYNLRLFEDCIELCKYVLEEDNSNSEIQIESMVAIYNSYYYLDDLDNFEYYLKMYTSHPLADKSRSKFAFAALNAKKGETDLAITQLQECLTYTAKETALYVTNMLFELLIKKSDLFKVEELILPQDKRIKDIPLRSPYQISELARFYKFKGDYYVMKDLLDYGVDSYIESIILYAKVSAHDKGYEIVRNIVHLLPRGNMEFKMIIFKKIEKMYNVISLNAGGLFDEK
ncbi:XRE family transcriptional regulator [Brevibacillus laterosporus]|nr:helix-turn-helix transcriptional regulator [Brevibacillus laterosporus]TPG73165.1 XRE family transcriptional regulator [Brevibacillus laterosporus]